MSGVTLVVPVGDKIAVSEVAVDASARVVRQCTHSRWRGDDRFFLPKENPMRSNLYSWLEDDGGVRSRREKIVVLACRRLQNSSAGAVRID